MSAYAFARIRWPGREKVFLLYLATLMVPAVVLFVPNFVIILELNMFDDYTGLIIPAAFSAYGTFLLRQFMLTIPSSLDEAAAIDTVACPVHLLTGVYDYSATVEHGRAAHEAIAGSTFEVMDEIGHFPMSENPDQFLRHLLPVLDKIS